MFTTKVAVGGRTARRLGTTAAVRLVRLLTSSGGRCDAPTDASKRDFCSTISSVTDSTTPHQLADGFQKVGRRATSTTARATASRSRGHHHRAARRHQVQRPDGRRCHQGHECRRQTDFAAFGAYLAKECVPAGSDPAPPRPDARARQPRPGRPSSVVSGRPAACHASRPPARLTASMPWSRGTPSRPPSGVPTGTRPAPGRRGQLGEAARRARPAGCAGSPRVGRRPTRRPRGRRARTRPSGSGSGTPSRRAVGMLMLATSADVTSGGRRGACRRSGRSGSTAGSSRRS